MDANFANIIDNEVILVLDFQKTIKCMTDIAQGTFIVQDQTVRLRCFGYTDCSMIIAKEMVQITPRSETIINGKMVESLLENGWPFMIEPSEKSGEMHLFHEH